MSLLKVLLVTYSFPPAGGVGVLRAASLARYFPHEGIELEVLTTRNASAVGADSALLKEIPAQVKVHRTLTLDLPFGIKKWMKKLILGRRASRNTPSAAGATGKSNFLKTAIQDALLPDPQVTWLPVLARAARRIIKKQDIDLVLITVPPFSSVLLVEKLRKEFPDLAIVLDFRDEWLSTTIDFVGFSRSERARTIARNSESNAVHKATAVVAVTEAARRQIRARYPQQPDHKFHLIPNGFDATKMPTSVAGPVSRHEGKIVVTHIGTVYASTDPTTLVEALQSLPAEVKSRFIIRFIGHIEEARFREALLQLGEMVELKGFLPQHEALSAMSETDFVLLIHHDPLNVGAKFYDYIGGGKPILGAVHAEGEARRLLEKFRAGWWAGNHDVEAIRQLFIAAASRENPLTRQFHPDLEGIAQYERKVLAQRYAALLHSIVKGKQEGDSELLAAQGTGEAGR